MQVTVIVELSIHRLKDKLMFLAYYVQVRLKATLICHAAERRRKANPRRGMTVFLPRKILGLTHHHHHHHHLHAIYCYNKLRLNNSVHLKFQASPLLPIQGLYSCLTTQKGPRLRHFKSHRDEI